MRRAYRSFALFFLTYPAFVAAALAKICPLNNAPVPLEYDEAKGEFSLLESSIENKEEGGDRTTDEEVRLLERAVLRTVQVAGSNTNATFGREEKKSSKSIWQGLALVVATRKLTV